VRRANEPASVVFASLDPSQRYQFDRWARTRTKALAAELGVEASVSLNFPPKSLDTLPDAVTSTMEAAHGPAMI
jgi:hypothetical protein